MKPQKIANHSKDNKPAVVMFGTKKCPQCDVFESIFNKYEMGFGESVNFIKINTEDEPVVASGLKIFSMPAILFIFIGMTPRTELSEDVIQTDKYGYIITDENMAIKIPGVYTIGDVRQKTVRQIANAVGDGAVAAVFAEKYIFSMEE